MNRILTALILTALAVAPALADIHNPKPAPDDFVLPMPGGASMAFRPVVIGEGARPFSMRKFKVGLYRDTKYLFKEYPTDVLVGGAFIRPNRNNQADWIYYIGKYEVTDAQYQAVMEPQAPTESRLPKTNVSWFDVQNFLHHYNTWLFANARDKLPVNEEAVGFLRLPTEIEWEFAARGGGEVPPDFLDKKHPYPEPLGKYEWFEGAQSSHGKVQPVGGLEPNPSMLHDMLGNVSEMTASLYQIEYYQGRVGGFVSKGGNCFTSKEQIRSAQREEIPFYKEIKGQITATRQPSLGFRVVISSPVISGVKTSEVLAGAWDDYLKTGRVTPVASPSTTALPQSAQTNVQLADAMKSLEKLSRELSATPGVSQTALDQMGILSASFKTIGSMVSKAEHDSAFSWIKVASETAYIVQSREIKELPDKKKALEVAKTHGKVQFVDGISAQIAQKEKNIGEGLSSYGFAFLQLEKIDPAVIQEGFGRYREFLTRRGAADQLRMTDLVQSHYQEYVKTRALNTEKWRGDLEKF